MITCISSGPLLVNATLKARPATVPSAIHRPRRPDAAKPRSFASNTASTSSGCSPWRAT
ncbi:MAG: hypothetical protein ABI768_03395 [Acidobacteriota bacterium]